MNREEIEKTINYFQHTHRPRIKNLEDRIEVRRMATQANIAEEAEDPGCAEEEHEEGSAVAEGTIVIDEIVLPVGE